MASHPHVGRGLPGFTMILCLALTLPAAAQPSPKLQYWVDLSKRHQHLFQMVCEVSELTDATINLALPSWTATYQIRDFAQYIRAMEVTDGQGNSLPWMALDKQTWQVDLQGATTLRVIYKVYANTLGSFDSQINDQHAFFNGAQIFLYPSGERGRPLAGPVLLHLAPPPDWHIATGLDATGDPNTFRADDYDHLVDCPVEMGRFQRHTFTVREVPVHLVIDASPSTYDADALVAMVSKVVQTAVDLMGDVPFSHYTFIYHFPDFPTGGGMEHRNSTAITSRRRGPKVNIQALAGVTTHEFFHLWNVERITPAALMHYDYGQENYTHALYISEGWTSYYTSLLLARSGLRNKEEFYRSHEREITSLQNRPARLTQSVERSSWLTWLDKYAWYRQPEVSISYYNKGYLIGLLLDLAIRDVTDNRRSLDDVVRFMNWYFAHRQQGFRGTDDVQWVVNAVAQHDFSDFFDRYVRGTEEIPWNDYFQLVGLRLESTNVDAPDAGFVALRNGTRPTSPLLIDRLSPDGNGVRAGLQAADRIVALEGRPVVGSWAGALRAFEAGQDVVLTIIRGRRIRQDALKQVFTSLKKSGSGNHETPHEGAGVERLSETRPYQFGDNPTNIDYSRTIKNAIQRAGLENFNLTEDDFEVYETEHLSSCATVLMIDISHSMILYGEDRITPAKQVAMALAELVTTQFPRDVLEVLVFGDRAERVRIDQLPFLQVGPFHTNTKHGLQVARNMLSRKSNTNKQIFMVTDGKPSAMFDSRGRFYRNSFGLDPRIVNRTLDEAVICRRQGIVISTFMVARDPYLVNFVRKLTEMNRGRAYYSHLDKLGEYVFEDYLRNRRRRLK